MGEPGEPDFENGWADIPPSPTLNPNPVGFYKDHEGIVHLTGLVDGSGATSPVAFQLPPGYRPGSARVLYEQAACTGPCSSIVVAILGSDTPSAAFDGAVSVSSLVTVSLDGITFRAES